MTIVKQAADDVRRGARRLAVTRRCGLGSAERGGDRRRASPRVQAVAALRTAARRYGAAAGCVAHMRRDTLRRTRRGGIVAGTRCGAARSRRIGERRLTQVNAGGPARHTLAQQSAEGRAEPPRPKNGNGNGSASGVPARPFAGRGACGARDRGGACAANLSRARNTRTSG
ncbi:hypothetical protein WS72_30775 [Burkholderia savannae]|uniref:Uncharacterized protein n=1 Tax=Burkholderia savannae TaxID=1637837 RepID=A0ABR5T7E1_9BURK|nr:hypothetical protein WS72_30775 [Burkholderia savannae]